MKLHCFRLGAFVILLICACKKTQSINPQIIGNWNWVYTGFGTSMNNNQNSGIQKSVVFKSNGTIIITHNDSTSSPLLPAFDSTVLLTGGPVKDTTTFQTGMQNAGCINVAIPVLSIGTGFSYQYKVSNDSLYISTSECLAPNQSVFIKVN
jgi:hypothetical protein